MHSMFVFSTHSRFLQVDSLADTAASELAVLKAFTIAFSVWMHAVEKLAILLNFLEGMSKFFHHVLSQQLGMGSLREEHVKLVCGRVGRPCLRGM